MPLTYLDQNALIKLGVQARQSQFRRKIDSALASGCLNVVVSSWHLIETAHSARLEPALELAEFIESLRPAWLFERHDLLKIEVSEDFFKFASIPYPVTPRVTTRSAVIAALSNKPDGPRFDIPAQRFVKQWWENPDQLRPLEIRYQENADNLIRLRELTKQAKITIDIRNNANRLLLKHTVPTTTPSGVAVGREVRDSYIAQARVESIPTFSIENAISEQEWSAQGGTDRNTLIDKFHLISALPYVDEIVSDDCFFHKIYPVARAEGHVKANLLKNAEFLSRFP